MSIVETMVDIPAKHERDVCEQFDTYLKKIKRTLHVIVIARDGGIKIVGSEKTIDQAKNMFSNPIELSKRGNAIMGQNVGYILSLPFTESDGQILEIDEDIICRTISGKPVKSETLGQKHYVSVIHKKMIVSDTGPAGTGKIYLAVAIAIQAFKNGEVGHIILTRLAAEAGEKLRFLSSDLQSKIDPCLCPLYDTLYQIMGTESYLHNSERGFIEVAPLAYMRRGALDNTYIVLGETQDTTPAQMKIFLARIGSGSKVIITGDQTQEDPPEDAVSDPGTTLKVLKRIGNIEFCYLTNSDVVCYSLVQKIIQAYETYKQKNTPSVGWHRIRE